MPKKRTPALSVTQEEYLDGAIRKIKLTNFLIYDNVEVLPGPHLNVIIGPNATGKSTIVNAICLGLAGKTTVLGRAKDSISFIKNGCNKATIEIELYNSKGEPHIVTRHLCRSGTTNTWFINNRSVSQKAVEELVASLNIQVSNLCQFLPQDRVADFIKMSNTELLTNTLKAANRDLYDMHQKLKDNQKIFEFLVTDHIKVKEKLERSRKALITMEREVTNYNERKMHQEKLDILQLKRPWVEYEEYRQLHQRIKAEKDALEHTYRAAVAENQPTELALEQAKEVEERTAKEYKDCGVLITREGQAASNLNEKLQKFADEVEEVNADLKSKEKEEAARLKKLESYQAHIQGMEAQLASVEERDYREEIERLFSEMQGWNRQKMTLQQEIDSLLNLRDSKKLEIISIESEIQKVRDIDSQKLNVVRHKDKDTYEAILWLRRNQNLFSDTIYEPPMMCLNVKDPGNAKFLESSISFNDMKSFICLNEDDHEKFYTELRVKQNLKINAAVTLQNKHDTYKPLHPISNYSRFGFHSFLKDMIEAPGPVLSNLCHLSGLHRIPVGDGRVNNYIEEIPDQFPELTRYLSDTHSYSYKKSKFSGNIITRAVDLRAANILIHSVDESRLDELTKNLKKLKAEEQELNSKLNELEQQKNDLSKKSEDSKNRRKELLSKQNERRTLSERLSAKKESLAQLLLEAIDMESERRTANDKILKIYNKRLTAATQQRSHVELMVRHSKQRLLIGLQAFSLAQKVKDIQGELSSRTHQMQAIERELVEKKEQLNKARDQARRLQAEAKKAIGSEGGPSHTQLTQFKMLPNTLEEIDASIADLRARVDLILVDSDRSIVEDFSKLQQEIRLNERLQDEKEKAIATHLQEITTVKDTWLCHLQEVIHKINLKFSEYFRELNCAGEVNLKVPSNKEDYENYGISINVKYGDNKPFKELTTFQSGGERSVATVLYMLSLQQLSKSPFRCVDEINQGMDAENERKVFELVVKAACCPDTPQYFLLTPKLLPDLLYTERMTIHIVHNGPYMMDHKDWKLQEFIQKRSEFDDEDS